MRRYAMLHLAFALIGTAAAITSTAQAQGRPEVCFYEHNDFRGRAYCIGVGERVNFVGRSANNQFSSVRVPPGVTAAMCDDANFRGRCVTLRRSEPDFRRLGFNDRVSAVAAQWDDRSGHNGESFDHGWGRPRDYRDDRDRRDRGPRDLDRDRQRSGDDRRDGGGRGEVCFFEHQKYQGRSYCAPVGRAVRWVGDRYNDSFSSMRVPRGVTVTVCRDIDFRGLCHNFFGNVEAFDQAWNDTISSFRSR
jgi:Peptidase inhibitor family I36